MFSISKVCINKVADIFNDNTHNRTIKMNPIDKKSRAYIELNVGKMMKILNLKLETM